MTRGIKGVLERKRIQGKLMTRGGFKGYSRPRGGVFKPKFHLRLCKDVVNISALNSLIYVKVHNAGCPNKHAS